MSIESGVLYVVATPIGNLSDVGTRALAVLRQVDLIAAEDTRHSARLLRHYGIGTPTVSLHRHNERRAMARLVERLRRGESVALVSDAGTPLVSDPGVHLVGAARDSGVPVVPIPGPSALTAALSISGLPADRFVFEGFLPTRPAARQRRLQALAHDTRTLVFFEAPHRIVESMADMAQVFGADRVAVIVRELTKAFEEGEAAALEDLLMWLAERPERSKGEFVVMVHGAAVPSSGQAIGAEEDRILRVLLEELPPARAASVAARLTGKRKSLFYDQAVGITHPGRDPERP